MDRRGRKTRATLYYFQTWRTFAVVCSLVLAACGGGGSGGETGAARSGTPPSGLSYPSPSSATVGAALSLQATNQGEATNYSVTPALPPGLSLSTTTGQISGIPTASTPSVTYTVKASNAAGYAIFAVKLTVVPPPPTATTTNTTVTMDPGVPAAAIKAIAEIISPIGAGSPGASIEVPVMDPQAETLVLATDGNQNIILAGLVTTGSTTFDRHSHRNFIWARRSTSQDSRSAAAAVPSAASPMATQGSHRIFPYPFDSRSGQR